MKKCICILTLILSGCTSETPFFNPELQEYKRTHRGSENSGMPQFLMGTFGNINAKGLTDGRIVPKKVYDAAIVAAHNELDGPDLPYEKESVIKILKQYGFTQPTEIANWDTMAGPQPEISYVTGLVTATIDMDPVPGPIDKRIKVQAAGINCTACHSGVTYDSSGMPNPNRIWLGAPSTSINFDKYLGSIYRGLVVSMEDRDLFLSRIKSMYPELDEDEEDSIEDVIFPAVESELKNLNRMGRVRPFDNGGPGVTNGAGAFRFDADLMEDKYVFNYKEAAFVSVPDLSWRGFRSAFTIDNTYGVFGKERFREVGLEEAMDDAHLRELGQQAAFFTFSAMGNTINNAAKYAVPEAEKVLVDFKDLEPMPFPGELDRSKALKGFRHYERQCAECHGQYEWRGGEDSPRLTSFPNRFVPQMEMGSDPVRWQRIDEDIARFVRETPMGDFVDAGVLVGGYVSPMLTGLWASAPYMHNGSVPTFWHFMRPELRPTYFEYGAHKVDMQKIGIHLVEGGDVNGEKFYLFPDWYTPFADSATYDTTLIGKSNSGHEFDFQNMSDVEKDELLEFLKLL